MHVCERQAGTRSMHIQYSNSNVSILLVSLLSRVSGSLRTTPFHFLEMFLHLFLLHLQLTSMVYASLCIKLLRHLMMHALTCLRKKPLY